MAFRRITMKRRYNREYYAARAEALKAKRRARYRAKVLGAREAGNGSEAAA